MTTKTIDNSLNRGNLAIALENQKVNITDWGMPDYTAGVGYAGNTWIQAPYDCYVIGGLQSGDNKETQIHVNARATESNYVILRRIYGYANIQGAFIRKGFYFRLSCNGGTYNTMYFPLMGVK